MKTKLLAFILIIGVFFICFSCANDGSLLQRPPDNLIPREKMINVLVDIHLIEASVSQYYSVNIDVKLRSAAFYTMLYKKYSITHKDFINSIYYYAQDLKYLGKIYQEVITRLSVMQTASRQNK